jgi:hypothetical protein
MSGKRISSERLTVEKLHAAMGILEKHAMKKPYYITLDNPTEREVALCELVNIHLRDYREWRAIAEWLADNGEFFGGPEPDAIIATARKAVTERSEVSP